MGLSVKEVANKLPRGCKTKYLNNVKTQRGNTLVAFGSNKASTSLMSSFTWSDSAEGQLYWAKIYELLLIKGE